MISYRITNKTSASIKLEDIGVALSPYGGNDSVAIVTADQFASSKDISKYRNWLQVESINEPPLARKLPLPARIVEVPAIFTEPAPLPPPRLITVDEFESLLKLVRILESKVDKLEENVSLLTQGNQMANYRGIDVPLVTTAEELMAHSYPEAAPRDPAEVAAELEAARLLTEQILVETTPTSPTDEDSRVKEAELEAAKKAEEEENARLAAEKAAEAAKKAEEKAAKKAEAAAKKLADEEAAKKLADEETAKKAAADEDARLMAELEAEEAAKKAAESAAEPAKEESKKSSKKLSLRSQFFIFQVSSEELSDQRDQEKGHPRVEADPFRSSPLSWGCGECSE